MTEKKSSKKETTFGWDVAGPAYNRTEVAQATSAAAGDRPFRHSRNSKITRREDQLNALQMRVQKTMQGFRDNQGNAAKSDWMAL